MPHTNVTIEDLLGAQKTLVEAIDDIGVVLTRERYLDEDGWISLFTALNPDESAKGVMILWQQLVSQEIGPRVCTVLQRHQFSYEILYPFDDNRPDGRTSHEVFVERVQSINDAINNVPVGTVSWNLGITVEGSDVLHQFLQSDGPMVVRRWGSGPTARKTHYISMTLEVLVVVTVHA